jgi:uncharacterized protein YjbJ (UPF0337 family)
MNKDQMEGAVREGVGALKEGAGKLVGDAKTRAEGIYDQAAGAAQRTYGQARDIAEEGAAVVQRQVETNPWSAVIAIGAIGFVLGWIARGRG